MWPFKKANSTPSDYEEILKIDLNDIDYAALRIAYTKTDFYNPYNKNDLEELSNLFKEGEYGEVLKKAKNIQKMKFASIDYHMLVYSAAIRLNDSSLASLHGAIAKKLMESVLKSGDGRTPESAYTVISTDEEYAFLGVLGLKMKTQSLIKVKNSSYDLLEVVDKEGNGMKIYFNIDIPFNWLDNKMKKKA
jgi:hypothetical protein